MNNTTYKTYKAFLVAILIALIMQLFLSLFSIGVNLINITRILDVSSGYVVDKQIVHGTATYILCLDGEFTNAFNKPTACTKKYLVDMETYNKYEVGDYFDSKDINIVEEEEL